MVGPRVIAQLQRRWGRLAKMRGDREGGKETGRDKDTGHRAGGDRDQADTPIQTNEGNREEHPLYPPGVHRPHLFPELGRAQLVQCGHQRPQSTHRPPDRGAASRTGGAAGGACCSLKAQPRSPALARPGALGDGGLGIQGVEALGPGVPQILPSPLPTQPCPISSNV